jgi:hypothetical protein
MVTMLVEAIAAQIAPLNELGSKIKSATKVSGKVVSEIRNDEAKGEEFPWLAEFQKWEDDANAEILARRNEINARIRTEIIGDDGNGFDPDAAAEEYKTALAEVKTNLKALKVLSEEDYDALAATLQHTSVRSSQGTGNTKRPRLSEAYVDGEQVANDEGKVSFTHLAKYLSDLSKASVAGSDLQQAAFTAAGTDTLSDVSGQPVEFEFSVDENSAPYSITVTPV